ncbi:MAG: hypothetical protein H6843_13940 [Rhodospirillaceae bacterium]|nr:hypothetical protein [Rhodospirillaceae bacterium]
MEDAGGGAARGASAAALFLFILFMEWRKGSAADDDAYGDDEAIPEEEERAVRAAYAQRLDSAVRLLDLPTGFDQAALNRAFKRAMQRVHPDCGGSTAQAQRVNLARDLIRDARGWS